MRLLILTQYFAPETGAAPVRLVAFARELLVRLGRGRDHPRIHRRHGD
jgi:hypothetical protein